MTALEAWQRELIESEANVLRRAVLRWTRAVLPELQARTLEALGVPSAVASEPAAVRRRVRASGTSTAPHLARQAVTPPAGFDPRALFMHDVASCPKAKAHRWCVACWRVRGSEYDYTRAAPSKPHDPATCRASKAGHWCIACYQAGGLAYRDTRVVVRRRRRA